MTPTQIKATLEQLGARPNKNLGQHFLIDKTALEAIVQAADIKQGDRVLEVGPGLGVLTHALLERGAEVVAIEKDRRFAELMTPLLKVKLSLAHGGGGIVTGDAAKLEWDEIIGSKPWKFVSNLPYAITSLALRKALYAKNPPTMVVVLVQREVAERVLARDGKMSLLSLMVGLAVGPENNKNTQIIRRVPAGAFYPPPKVESAILSICPMSNVQRQKTWGIEPEEVMAMAKKGFAHPRKLLQRNLGIENGQWQELSKELGFDLKTRAEDLTIGQWAGLAKIV